jgi:hypothetical protein
LDLSLVRTVNGQALRNLRSLIEIENRSRPSDRAFDRHHDFAPDDLAAQLLDSIHRWLSSASVLSFACSDAAAERRVAIRANEWVIGVIGAGASISIWGESC